MGIFLNSGDQAVEQPSTGYRLLGLITIIYLLLFPISSTVLDVVSGAIIVFIVLSSIVLYLFPRKKRTTHSNHEERMFYFSISFMVIVLVLVEVISGVDYLAMKKLGKFVYMLMVIPAYFYFRNVRVNVAWIWYGLVIGSIISFIIGAYEVANEIYKPGYPGRAKGATHPIIFGDLALIMGAMAFAGWGWFKTQAKWQVILPGIALCSGVFASIFSQSRGGWIAIPFLMVVIIWYYSAYISKLKMMFVLVVVFGLIVVAYQVPQFGMKLRVDSTVDNIQKYIYADEKSTDVGTSVSSRLEMWKASWNIFLENPILGVGWGGYQENVSEQVKQGKRTLLIGGLDPGNFNHPHNQFLSALVSGGLISLAAIILLFFIPAKIFYNACKSPERSPDAQQIALAGLVLMVGFTIFNISESFLERSRTVSFLIFYLAVFMAGIRETNAEVVSRN